MQRGLKWCLGISLALVAGCSDCGDSRRSRPMQPARTDAASVDAGTSDVDVADASAFDADPLQDVGFPLDVGTTADSGPADTGVADSGAVPDAGQLSPADCPVGVADGCCGLQGAGGRDPDCPSLDCDLTLTSTMTLAERVADPHEPRRGGTAMAWTGTELVLVRMRPMGERFDADWEHWIEHRDNRGQLLSSRGSTCAPRQCRSYGPNSLAWEPRQDRFLYGDVQAASSYQLFAFDRTSPVGPPSRGGFACNPETSSIKISAGGGRFVALWDNGSCDSTQAGGRGAQVRELNADGTMVDDRAIATLATQAAFACGADCDTALFTYYSSGVEIAEHDVRTNMTTVLQSGPPLFGGMDYAAAVWDGQAYFIVWNQWPTGGRRIFAERYDPMTGRVGDRTMMGAGHRGHAPSLVWTGEGYFMAVATFDQGERTAFPDREEHFIELFHFNTDGSLRQRFRLETEAGLYPQLAWAGGRIAITWVRVPDPVTRMPETRHLGFFECQP